MNVLTELWYLIRHGRGWRDVHRTMRVPRLGELHFFGRRSRPDGPVDGYWKVQPPGFDRPVGVTFQSEGGEPTPEGLEKVEALAADLDTLFERSRPAMAAAYEQFVEESMPAEWRAAFQLDHISLPDPDDPLVEWQVSYWCEPALHWFVVDYSGETAVRVEIEG